MAYSLKIHDPAFDKYLKKTKDYRLQFSFVLAVIAVVGFYVYGEVSDEMLNPKALYVGLVIGGTFFLFGLYILFSLKKSPSWDGKVIEKEIVDKNGDTFFIVYFLDQKQQKHQIQTEDNVTLYKYFKIGDEVRFHGHLNTYEKLDKSHDAIIFCNACSLIHDINEHFCRNCGCPLLK